MGVGEKRHATCCPTAIRGQSPDRRRRRPKLSYVRQTGQLLALEEPLLQESITFLLRPLNAIGHNRKIVSAETAGTKVAASASIIFLNRRSFSRLRTYSEASRIQENQTLLFRRASARS